VTMRGETDIDARIGPLFPLLVLLLASLTSVGVPPSLPLSLKTNTQSRTKQPKKCPLPHSIAEGHAVRPHHVFLLAWFGPLRGFVSHSPSLRAEFPCPSSTEHHHRRTADSHGCGIHAPRGLAIFFQCRAKTQINPLRPKEVTERNGIERNDPHQCVCQRCGKSNLPPPCSPCCYCVRYWTKGLAMLPSFLVGRNWTKGRGYPVAHPAPLCGGPAAMAPNSIGAHWPLPRPFWRPPDRAGEIPVCLD